MNSVSLLDRVRIVLSHPSHPGNIGATARAMKTMGLRHLYLVQPESYPDPVADARASGAIDVLQSAVVCQTLEEALIGTHYAAALTARKRLLSVPAEFVRQAAVTLAGHASEQTVAVVFGHEKSGLSNEEVSLCQLPVNIPTDSEYRSLNLAAAVQIVCYELRMAAMQHDVPERVAVRPASFEEVEGFYGHLETAMIDSGFYDVTQPRKLIPRIRRLFARTQLEKEEVGILRGILSALMKKVD